MTHHLSCQELPTCRHWGWHGIALPLNFTQLCATETMRHHSWPWKVFCWLLEVIGPCSAHTSVPAQGHAARFSLKQQLSEYEKRQELHLMCNPMWWLRENYQVLEQSKVKLDTEISAAVGKMGFGFAIFVWFVNSRFKRLQISWKCYLSKPSQMKELRYWPTRVVCTHPVCCRHLGHCTMSGLAFSYRSGYPLSLCATVS